MSTDPTGLDGKNCINSIQEKYVNIKFAKKDWCDYKGKCLIDNILFDGKDVCLLCKHRIPLDIPWLLDKKFEENKT